MSRSDVGSDRIIKQMIIYIATHKTVHYPDLMKFLNISRRTTVRYLDEIEKLLEGQQLELVRKRNVGIYFKGNLESLFSKLNDDDSIMPNQVSRENMLMLELLMNDSPVTLEYLSEKFFISRSTLDRDISTIKKQLSDTNLAFVGDRQGIQIKGKEEDRRNFASKIISKYWKEEIRGKSRIISVPPELRQIVSEKTIEEIQDVLNRFRIKTDILFTEFQYQSILIHIAIMIDRIRQKQILATTNNSAHIQQPTKVLCQLLEDKFNMNIPASERNYLDIHILAAQKGMLTKATFTDNPNSETSELFDFLRLNLIEYDDKLVEELALHLGPAIHRAKMNLGIYNPYTEQIKKLYPVAFSRAAELGEQVSQHYHVVFNDQELAYVALHFQAYIERSKNSVECKRPRIVVVCSTGVGTASILTQRIKSMFGDRIQISRVISVNKLFKSNVDEDIIVSTIPLNYPGKNVIQMSPISSRTDLDLLKKEVHSLQQQKSRKMFLQLVSPLTSFVGDNQTADDIIEMLGNNLIQLGNAIPGTVESIKDREKISSTALKDLSIAMPHPQPKFIKHSSISIYASRTPISWGNTNVNLVFLFAYSQKDIKQLPFDEIYHEFNLVISSSQVKQKIINASSGEEIVSAIQKLFQ